MATYRIGIGSFNLKDGAVGIGTESSGLGNLKVEGTYKTTDLDVIGVSTFARYAGFAAEKINVIRDTSLSSEHSTIGDIVVGLNSTFTVSAAATVTVGTVESVSIGTHFSPPTGGVEERPEAPVEGTVRFNEDLNTLEFYNGVEWKQFSVTGSRGRGFSMGGLQVGSVFYSNIDYINIASKGNAIDFGSLHQKLEGGIGCGNEIRGLNGGGNTPSDLTQIDYFTMASLGDAIDFGDLTSDRLRGSGLASSTRGIFVAGRTPASVNIIDYVTIMTTGNAIDFGDTVAASRGQATASSPTRGIIANGMHQGGEISYVTISSTGNATDFGKDIYVGGYCFNGGSTGVRAVWAGGYSGTSSTPYGPGVHTNSIRGVIIASGGIANEFGELNRSIGFTYIPGLSNKTRACWCGGYRVSPTPYLNTIDYFQMNSTGKASDFGDLTYKVAINSTCSDSHGGLGGY